MRFLTYIFPFLLMISAKASVVMPQQCKLRVEVVSSEISKGGDQTIVLVAKRGDKSWSPVECGIINYGKKYKGIVPLVYRGKYLRIPALKASVLKKGDRFTARVIWNEGDEYVTWEILYNKKSIKQGTSFQTTKDPI